METDNFWEIKKKLTFTEICVEVRRLGDDYHILVSGGECPHIGCTVLAIPRPSLDGSGKMSSTASVLNVTEVPSRSTITGKRPSSTPE